MLDTSNNSRFKDHAYFNEYISLLLRLHELVQAGNEVEADHVRELMDEPGLHLTEEEVRWVKRLSADLYSLYEEDVLEANPYLPEDYQKRAFLAFQQRDAETLLSLHRMKSDIIAPDAVAFGRSRGYAWLGFDEISLLFLQNAARLAPDGYSYLIFVMANYYNLRQYGKVWETAQAIFNTPTIFPEQTFLAAGIMFQIRGYFPANVRRGMLGKLRQVAEKTLRNHPTSEISSDSASFGNIILGLVQEALGRKGKAEECYADATEQTPQDDIAWLLLGNLLFSKDIAKSIFCFMEAVKRNTQHPVAYLVAAMVSLNNKEYETCMAFCKMATECNSLLGNTDYKLRIAAAIDEIDSQATEGLTGSRAIRQTPQESPSTLQPELLTGGLGGLEMSFSIGTSFLSARLQRLNESMQGSGLAA